MRGANSLILWLMVKTWEDGQLSQHVPPSWPALVQPDLMAGRNFSATHPTIYHGIHGTTALMAVMAFMAFMAIVAILASLPACLPAGDLSCSFDGNQMKALLDLADDPHIDKVG